jgi:hypothetical protein
LSNTVTIPSVTCSVVSDLGSNSGSLGLNAPSRLEFCTHPKKMKIKKLLVQDRVSIINHIGSRLIMKRRKWGIKETCKGSFFFTEN